MNNEKGIVIGKFYPPHLGHNYLIDTAIRDQGDVDVLVVDNPEYVIPAQKRRDWIAAHHPEASVQIIPDINNDDDSEAWGKYTIDFLGYRPAVVFSSEPYGKPWAEAMGCDHVDVDVPRSTIPISGTKVREDFLQSWDYLSDEVKAGLALRVVIVGAESTGTTTLSHDLAEQLQVPWVPEIGRYYTESILTDKQSWNDDDFYRIGKLQQAYENAIAVRSNGVIVCDTNATATEIWQRRYIGRTSREMGRIAMADKADLYIITGDEIPFVQDGLRDGEHIRHRMQRWFIDHIKKTGVPYVTVQGDKTIRLESATKAAQQMIDTRRTIQ